MKNNLLDREEKSGEGVATYILICLIAGEPTRYWDESYKSINEIFEVDSKFEVRNLKNFSVQEILLTYSDHEEKLKELYGQHIKETKRNYMSKDIPQLMEFDIVNEKQLQAMAVFAETHLVCNLAEEFDSTQVIFESILPEWALAAFCKKFKLSRLDAVKSIKLQSKYEIEMAE